MHGTVQDVYRLMCRTLPPPNPPEPMSCWITHSPSMHPGTAATTQGSLQGRLWQQGLPCHGHYIVRQDLKATRGNQVANLCTPSGKKGRRIHEGRCMAGLAMPGGCKGWIFHLP